MSSALALGLAAAVCLAIGAVLTKEFVDRLPGRQLIGPLFALNALLVVPAAPFVEWHLDGRIALLHLASVVALLVTTGAVFALYEHGSASATTTAQALSPVPAAIAAWALLGQPLEPLQGIAAALVVAAVVASLPGAFESLGRRGAVRNAALAAGGAGLITVLGRLLADEGASTVEIYLVRTAAAAVIFTAAIPPRQVPLRVVPWLAVRAAFVSAQFLLVIVAVRDGSPAVVQTAVATTPLWALGVEAVRTRTAPSLRVTVCAVVVVLAVALLGMS
jgi:drug/metabolite transporter (DMT)-like permease